MEPQQIPDGALQAYQNGTMDPDDAIEMELAVERGEWAVPAGFQLRRTTKGVLDTTADTTAPVIDTLKGITGAVSEAVTGAQRRTATTEAASDITLSPEWQQLTSLLPQQPQGGGLVEQVAGGVKTALAATPIGQIVQGARGMAAQAASPEEQIQILQANFPDLKIQRDEKGNAFFTSANGQTYSVQPGLRLTDAPRVVAQGGAFLPAGGVAGIGGAVAANALTQAGLEAAQATQGGGFDPAEVLIAGATGGLVPAVQAARQGVRGAAGAADDAVRAVGEAVEAAPTPAAPRPVPGAPMPEAELGDLVRKAGDGNTVAQARLAEAAAINPEARAAAERLGMDLPADVFADNDQIRAVIGLVRSKVGGEAEAAWKQQVRGAVDKADEAIAQFDAAFVEGAPSVGNVSDKVLTTLQAQRGALKDDAAKLYADVDAAFKPTDKVTLNRTRDQLMKIAEEVGEELTPEERKLLASLKAGDVRYGALKRLKAQIGEAVEKRTGAFANVDAANAKRLYAALAEDQLENAERVAGDEVRRKLRAANLLTAKQKGLEKRIVGAFGKEVDGSIGSLLQRSITQAATGDGAAFAKVLKVVPPDLQREAIGTALASVTRAKGGAEAGRFGFAEWAKTYRGLRANAPVYAQIVKVLGPESDRVMRDLYEVSKRITDARAGVYGTGKSLQPVLDQVGAENLIGKILSSTIGRGAVAAGAGAVSGPAGAMGAAMLADVVAKGSRDGVAKAGKLFASEDFQRLAIEAATKPKASPASVRRVAMSQAWREFAKAARLPRQPKAAEAWLTAAMQAGQQEARQ